jgi:hypothetical protein
MIEDLRKGIATKGKSKELDSKELRRPERISRWAKRSMYIPRSLFLNEVSKKRAEPGFIRDYHKRALLCPILGEPMQFRDAFILRYDNGLVLPVDAVALAKWFTTSARFVCPCTTKEIDSTTVKRLQDSRTNWMDIYIPGSYVHSSTYVKKDVIFRNIMDRQNLLTGLERTCDTLLSQAIDVCLIAINADDFMDALTDEGDFIDSDDEDDIEEAVDERRKIETVSALMEEWRAMVDQTAPLDVGMVRQFLSRDLHKVEKDQAILNRIGSNAFSIIQQVVRNKFVQFCTDPNKRRRF